jgi:hypothetical protein
MYPFWGNVAALAVAAIYYCWRGYHALDLSRKQRTLRHRVAYMLWCAAQRADVPQPVRAD